MPHPAATFVDAPPDKECGVEAEWCFQIGADVKGDIPITPQSIAMYVRSIYPAIEVVASRVSGATFATIGDPDAPWPPPYVVAADMGLNHACVVGPPVFLCCDQVAGVKVSMSVNGGPAVAAGTAGANVCPPDGPMASLAWLARHLLERGMPLKVGDLVMSGATCGLTTILPGDVVLATFEIGQKAGKWPTLEVVFTAPEQAKPPPDPPEPPKPEEPTAPPPGA